MSKSFSFPNVGTCSKQTNIVLNDDHTIESVEVIGGCNGNLKGISRLLKGMKAEDAIARRALHGAFLLCSALSVSLCSTALPKGEPTHRFDSAAPEGQAAIGSPLGGAGKADRL